ncbi:NifU family protein [Haloarchaeobius amylolyticus]|uniref:NifU family protein n=1 Tax=Haloarchaeobius amylolyticus TaxID=1198296 RepID=UPI002271E8E9|nr:NifU family protein [Haloarchaeobius amylolyticus]
MTDEADLRDRLGQFLARNFPQIELHGGSYDIAHLDADEGTVTVLLTGACEGCGISELTIGAVRGRLLSEFPELTEVHVETGLGADAGPMQDDFSDVPF